MIKLFAYLQNIKNSKESAGHVPKQRATMFSFLHFQRGNIDRGYRPRRGTTHPKRSDHRILEVPKGGQGNKPRFLCKLPSLSSLHQDLIEEVTNISIYLKLKSLHINFDMVWDGGSAGCLKSLEDVRGF